MKIVVGSKNPVKIEAAKIAFEKCFPNEEVLAQGVSADSNVSDQPMGDEETLSGARNRALHAQELERDADFWIGLEGGNIDYGDEMTCIAWMYICSKDKEGKARAAEFVLPKKLADLVRSGMELGDADDLVFGRTNSKQSNGTVGILTKDALTRTEYYEQAILLALIPFIDHPGLNS